MNAPRLNINLTTITHNARVLVGLLAPKGIQIAGISKAVCGSPDVAEAMLRGGAARIGDSRVENLTRLRVAGVTAPLTLVRSPMLSQVEQTVLHASTSLNTEPAVLDALSEAAVRLGVTHGVILMVELGDLREGIAADDVVAAARAVERSPGLTLEGLGTNLACHSGVVPDQRKMDELSRLADSVEAAVGHPLSVISGGNSANLEWALSTSDTGRITELRLGEAILLGTEPLQRSPIAGLQTGAFTLVGEVIEAKLKPVQPWGEISAAAFSHRTPPVGNGFIRQAIVALGRQDTDLAGLIPPAGITMIGMSSDHLVVDLGDQDVSVGDELTFGLDYSALMVAATSPFVGTRTFAN
ncbi:MULTISPECIES: alanine/ornithine racemase family PLP-dependent enzyme [unclassified Leucobacter]|uniref:alanine/ornithine racemase family PLP-dependent enzyme n=1 Tax=unclassified Leucobacter TaxID=2621730 RepID=UPI00165D66C0|nr:alanine/ornithine racemase family PLP-dependent enzyme [Leucobacter sp. CX169]MBC9926253.1 alanine/ornithine racemase family PLP-dependent enzyme [Leucobacter sp. cx-169]